VRRVTVALLLAYCRKLTQTSIRVLHQSAAISSREGARHPTLREMPAYFVYQSSTEKSSLWGPIEGLGDVGRRVHRPRSAGIWSPRDGVRPDFDKLTYAANCGASHLSGITGSIRDHRRYWFVRSDICGNHLPPTWSGPLLNGPALGRHLSDFVLVLEPGWRARLRLGYRLSCSASTRTLGWKF